ncbi:acyltransferase family protein [Nonomuraea sp. NPDC050310]|uniref:acyltransferase family protein n=1 Tax=Nonomuraea sp. NPDC050310 TaxID=3154935 RepID=UPI0033D78F6B
MTATTTAPPAAPRLEARVDAITGLRAVAALAILVYHAAGITGFIGVSGVTGALLARGDLAVSVFFGLSGLLLFRPWARRIVDGTPAPGVGLYLRRRALRILPGYWATVIVAMTLIAEAGGYSVKQWVQMLLLVHIYDPAAQWPNGGLGPAALGQMWSLAVEVAFYLLLPVIAWLIGRYARRGETRDRRAARAMTALFAMGAVSFLFAIVMFYPERIYWLYALLPHHAVFFAVGMGIALLLVWADGDSPGARRAGRLRDTIAASTPLCLVAAAVSYLLLSTPIVGRFGDPYTTLLHEEVRLVLHTCITFLLIAPLVCARPGQTGYARRLSGPVMRFLGQISYGIFLWQFVALEAIYRFTGTPYFSGGFWYVLPLSLLITLLLATLTYYLLEAPFSRVQGSMTAQAAAPARESVPLAPLPEKRPEAPKAAEPRPTRPEKPEKPVKPAKVKRPAGEHIDALDGVRAVAALAVLVFHVAAKTGLTEGWGAWLASRGDIGVAIFFTLSGLLLYKPWARAALAGTAAPDTRAYLLRRLFRIVPAYWLVAAVALTLFNQAHSASQWFWAKWLLLLQIYDVDSWWQRAEGRGIEQVWSLSVEIAFYLVLPLLGAVLTWLAGRAVSVAARAVRLLVALLVMAALSMGVVFVAHLPGVPPEINMILPRYLLWFAPGMALAVLAVWAELEPDGRLARFCSGVSRLAPLSWTMAVAAYAVASTPMTGPLHLGVAPAQEGTGKALLSALVGLFLVAPSAFAGRRGLATLIFGNPVVRYLGKISYGIFLWQFVVIYGYYLVIGNTLFLGGDFWQVLGIAAAGTIVLSVLSYHAVEEPFHKLGRYLGRPSAARDRDRAAQVESADA